MRRIDNSNIIEHAAIVKGLDKENIQNKEIGSEIAKYVATKIKFNFKYFRKKLESYLPKIMQL